ncbi:MAG: DUF1826 domain-containing protein [Thermonemataceae bacterium]
MVPTNYTPSHAAIGVQEKILQQIHLKTKSIAVYQRDINPLRQALTQVAEQSFECRASGTVEEITDSFNTYFADKLPNQEALSADVLKLLGLFKQITRTSSFRVLLATIHTNMCRKFHTDINDLRLLCTYVGPGTLWLPQEAVDPKASRAASNQEIVLDESLIQKVNTGDVVILKGALYPDANPILHRSPTIEGKGEKRLLLRIDTNESFCL